MTDGTMRAAASTSSSLVRRPSVKRSAPRASRARIAHGREDVRRLGRPRRAGRARRARQALEVEGHDELVADQPSDDDRERPRQPLHRMPRELDVGLRQDDRTQAITPRQDLRARPCSARRPPARRQPPCPPQRRRSPCPPAGSVPACRHGPGAGWRCRGGTHSAPIPAGPSALCAASETRSAPSVPTSSGSCPAAPTASRWMSAPDEARTRSTSWLIGCSVPTSLLATWRLTRIVVSERALVSSSGSTRP